MERFTERHTFEIRGLNGEKYNQSCIVLKATGQPAGNNELEKVYNKLAEFEDFMEEQGFESLEDLKITLKKCEDKYYKMNRDYQDLQHCIWKDTPIEQIRNNYERGHNFDFVGVAYNRGKAKIDRKVRQENQALKDRWNKLKEWAGYLCYFELVDKMQELEKEKNE